MQGFKLNHVSERGCWSYRWVVKSVYIITTGDCSNIGYTLAFTLNLILVKSHLYTAIFSVIKSFRNFAQGRAMSLPCYKCKIVKSLGFGFQQGFLVDSMFSDRYFHIFILSSKWFRPVVLPLTSQPAFSTIRKDNISPTELSTCITFANNV